MQNGHAAWPESLETRTCSTDMHCSMDMDMERGHGMDMQHRDMDMQHRDMHVQHGDMVTQH
jgi:hypothetical protein